MKSKHLPLIGAALCLLFSSPAPSARGATRTWSGNGSGNWSNPTNWVGNLAPISGDDVIFPADAVRFETTNDLSSLRLKSITSGTSYFLRGNAITLTNGIHVLKFLCTIEFVITLGADQTFDCADGGFLTVEGNMANNGHVLTVTNGGTVTLNGIISGTGGLAKTGDGHLEIVGANTYSGLTTVNQGFVFAENAAAFGGSAAGTVLNGGTIVVSLVDVLTESLTNNSSLDCLELYGRWGSNIVLNADLTVYVEDLFTGAVSGVVSGTGGLFKIGGATLRLSGANTYSGLTTVATGTLLVDNSQPESPVTVIDLFIRSQCGTCRATLGGVGTVGTITNLTGGTVGPGSSAGILTSSNVVFAPGAILSVELNGTAVGAGYDQLKARGAVSLSNATLKVAMGFVPAVGNRFTIIDNDGADAVIGTFNGLPESALFASGPALLRISYAGGTGNDVTLTVVQLIKVWTGLINGNWSNPTNWLGAIAPQVGEALVFPPDAVRFTMTNDFAPARLFDRATFTGSNYLLRGLSLILNNGIRAGQVLGTNAIETDVELRAFQSFVVSNSPASLIVRGNAVALGANALTVDGAGGVTISAAIGGSSSLTKQGAGTLEFSGATSNTFAGGVAVLQGTLLLNKTAFDGAIPASLQAGSLAAPPLPLTTNATVRWGRSNQVNNAAAVLATSDALLDLRPGADEIGSLRGSG
ncbi:MAG TPA: autotransporter-associated beta strand repeat-containing protein, partial [Verrucomicrobiae bacterium]